MSATLPIYKAPAGGELSEAMVNDYREAGVLILRDFVSENDCAALRQRMLEMIDEFARDGVKTVLITEPFILSTSTNWQGAVDNNALARTPTGEPRRFDFYFGNTGLVDVFDENAQQWFWQFYARLFEQGNAATWGDLGEPEVHPGDALHWLSDAGVQATGDEIHNAYGHVWAQTV